MNAWVQQRQIAKHKLASVLRDEKINHQSGIYLWKRTDEFGIKYFYVGQALDIYERQIYHLINFKQHIDLSIRKRGLIDIDNPFGWDFEILELCDINDLDEREHYWVMDYISRGWQTYNKTLGSQGQGKVVMDTEKQPKGYYDGLKQGYENARRDVAKLFKKYLKAEIQGTQGVRATNALNKFYKFLEGEKDETCETDNN